MGMDGVKFLTDEAPDGPLASALGCIAGAAVVVGTVATAVMLVMVACGCGGLGFKDAFIPMACGGVVLVTTLFIDALAGHFKRRADA